jgi:PIN domain nuclease of toxin-antitoxin system
VSVWEAVIKAGVGKWPFPDPPATYLPRERDVHGIAPLPLDDGAMTHFAGLPPLHRDPFDRILIAQALQHGLTLVTADAAVLGYPVPLLPPATSAP